MTVRVWYLQAQEDQPPFTWLSRPEDAPALPPGEWTPPEAPRILFDFTGDLADRANFYGADWLVSRQHILQNQPGTLLVSDRMLGILRDADPAGIRYARVETVLRDASGWRPGPPYWLIEAVRVVDALDYERSRTRLETLSDGRPSVVLREGSMIFRASDVGDAVIFRQRHLDCFIVTDPLKHIIGNADIGHYWAGMGFVADPAVREVVWTLAAFEDQIDSTWLNKPPYPYPGPLAGQPGAVRYGSGLPAMEQPPRFLFDLRSDAEWLEHRSDPDAPLAWYDLFDNLTRDLWLVSDRLMRLLLEIDPGAFDCVRAETILRLDDGDHEGPPYWLCDVVRIVDAIDIVKSNASVEEFGQGLISLRCPPGDEVFRRQDLGGAQIFRQLNGHRIYVTDSAKLRIEQSEFVGVGFLAGGCIDDNDIQG